MGSLTLRRIVGGAFVFIALVFLGVFIARDADRLAEFDWTIDFRLMATSVVVNVAGLLWGVLAWRMLLRMQGFPVRYSELARVWFVSGLGRYIPGKIWQFVGAAHLGTASGLPALVTVTSLAAHTFIFLVAAVVVAAFLVPAGAVGWSSTAVDAVQLLAPIALIALHPAVVRRMIGLIGRVTGKEVGEWKGTWSGTIVVLALAIFSWFITGVGLYLFIRSLMPLSPAVLPDVVGFNALAFVAGYLVFVAPAGLGAKEGMLAALLAILIPVSVAALVAVAARLWSIAAEVLPALVLLRKVPAGPPDPGGDRDDGGRSTL